MRVNARLDEATQQQLGYLTQATRHNVSHIVRESVAQYYAQVRQQREPSRFLAMAGTWRSGHTDTASTVKAVLAEALDAKLPQHPRPGVAPVKPQRAAAGRSSRARKA